MGYPVLSKYVSELESPYVAGLEDQRERASHTAKLAQSVNARLNVTFIVNNNLTFGSNLTYTALHD